MTTTRLKALPTFLRLFVGIAGLAGLVLILVLLRRLLITPTAILTLSISTFSIMTFLFLRVGLFSIKTFHLNTLTLDEFILWGLIKRKIPIAEIKNFKCHQARNKIAEFEELILNLKTGETIFIQEFDQKQFKELKNELKTYLPEDNHIKPNYWTKFNKTLVIMLLIWSGVIIWTCINKTPYKY